MTTSDSVSVKKKKGASLQLPISKAKKEKSSKKRKSTLLSESDKTQIPSDHDSPQVDVESSPLGVKNIDELSGSSEISLENRPMKKQKVNTEEIEVDITAPQPPSKKELRRLKKGKPLPRSKCTSTESKNEQSSQVEKKSEHGVWIGNLSFHVSKDDLRKFLIVNSEIEEDMITRIHMPAPKESDSTSKSEGKKHAQIVRNKGFAYVDFSNSRAVKKAVELSEQLLNGRRLLVKDNKSFEGRPEKTKGQSQNSGKPPSKRIFLGNLSFDTTEDSLKEHFQKCGPISSVKVATFEDTGKCKGYAWVVFEELEGAESAVRGFVRIQEPGSEPESDESSDEKDIGKSSQKLKVRKWWVNKIKGRSLRVEFAEDAQIRYKKRYGKDGSKNSVDASKTEKVNSTPNPVPATPAKRVEYRQPYAPRLTGGIIESKGKKVTF